MRENEVSGAILDSAIAVHRELGPGLLEHVYERALERELRARGHAVRRQVRMAVVYKGVPIEDAFVADLVVDEVVLVELKAMEDVADVHRRQVRTYLHASGLRLGLLVNFGGVRLKDGFERIVNGLPDA